MYIYMHYNIVRVHVRTCKSTCADIPAYAVVKIFAFLLQEYTCKLHVYMYVYLCAFYCILYMCNIYNSIDCVDIMITRPDSHINFGVNWDL